MSHPLQVTLVGCGAWGRNHARVLAQRGMLAAIVEPDPRHRAEAAARWPSARVVASPAEAPATVAAVIAAPAAEHVALARHYLQQGQHVLVEKPLALDLAEGRALEALAERLGLRLMVGHLLHYHPAVEALAALCDQGALGRLRYLYSNRLNLGRFRREESSLWSFAPHDVAVLLRLVGALPDRVIASGASFLHPKVADTTMSLLEWDSGIAAHMYVSWLHPFKEQRLVVAGELAMAVFDDGRPDAKLVLYRHGVDWRDGRPEPRRADAEVVPIEAWEPLGREIDVFAAWIADPLARPPSDAAEGLRVLTVLDAAQRSLERRGAPTAPTSPTHAAQIHPTATVGPQAVLGAGTTIWHYCHVMDGARIGAGCVLGQGCHVATGAVLGDRVRVQNHVSIYAGVELQDDVFVGPAAVFTNVSHPRVGVSRREHFEATVVERGASIGANATIVCGNRVGAWALVGAGAVVAADVPQHAIVVGNPARHVGWACRCGERLPLPARGDGGADAVSGCVGDGVLTAACGRCASLWTVTAAGLRPSAGGAP